MKVQNVANIIPISITPTPNLFHHNNVGGTYARTSNFKVEPIRSIPLYYVAMFHSMVIITKASFTTTPTHIIVGMRSRPQTPKGTDLANMHIDMSKEVDNFLLDNHQIQKEEDQDH
jgi:hypothetical protein